jgi:alkanesulfonate monooxygenase SsuD/methylene tetrahydromethanopterin reductase-like flavin-dependent oxidoreductase (luciferase family)
VLHRNVRPGRESAWFAGCATEQEGHKRPALPPQFAHAHEARELRLREHRGTIHDLDVVGRPDTLTVLNAIAAVTTHLGLGGTINTTFNEPYELARQFASLDHLSGGRAAWNLVTSSDAFTGENFRRGGFLKPEERYDRAQQILDAAKALWLSDREPVKVESEQFAFEGRFTLPPTPQGHPVLIQSGDSDEGREFGARTADAIFSRHGTVEAGQAFYQNIKGRMPRYGRRPEEITILPATTFALGDTEAEAREHAERVRQAQVSPQTAIAFLEQVWGRDLSAYDPDGPGPLGFVGGDSISTRHHHDDSPLSSKRTVFGTNPRRLNMVCALSLNDQDVASNSSTPSARARVSASTISARAMPWLRCAGSTAI